MNVKKTGWSDRELIRLQKNNATTTGPVLFNNRQFHIFFAAQCIWAYFGCGARHDEATCKQRFDDCVSGESCKYKLDFYLCIVLITFGEYNLIMFSSNFP